MAGRFVAVGDSFTEGVGDHNRHLPNQVRGWADRVAEQLAKHDGPWEYANLAVRSKRLNQIVEDQLAPALALKPTLITLYAGGNDILDAGTNMANLMLRYEQLVAALSTSGAQLALFTSYEVPLFPAVTIFRRRNAAYNAAVRRIAAEYDALLIDFAAFEGLREKRMWASDRLHLSKAGHKAVAAGVLAALGADHSIKQKDVIEPVRLTLVERMRAEQRWVRDWIIPLIHRKIRRVTLGDHLEPRWPEPVQVPPRGGLRKLGSAS